MGAREEKVTAQKEWEKRKLEQTRLEVNKKVSSYLHDFTEETKSTLYADWRDQEYLKQNREYLDNEINDLIQRKQELNQHIETIDSKTEEIKNWLTESES